MKSTLLNEESKNLLLSKLIYTEYKEEFKRAVIYIHVAQICDSITKYNLSEDFMVNYINKVLTKALKISREKNPNVPLPQPITKEMLETLPKKELLKKKNEQLVESKSFVMFVSLENTFIRHVCKKNLSLGKKLVSLLSSKEEYQDTMFKSILIHPPVFFHVVYKLFKPLIEPETREKIIIITKKNKKNMNVDEYNDIQKEAQEKNKQTNGSIFNENNFDDESVKPTTNIKI